MIKKILNTTVVVSALGYFVDIYDLLLFSIVRVPSLKSLQVPDEQILETGVMLLNAQMFGMLIGGICWGILGDKKGRLSVLFGSIFLYSAANFANGFVHSIETYAILRFIAGVGLAGELGAAITLVSEILHKDHRGYGTAIVASVGILGAVLAAFVGEYFDWRTAYMVGGALGIVLLVMRISMFESGMYHSLAQKKVKRGDLFLLLSNRKRFFKYLACISVGLPVWYVIGILITLSPELAKELQVAGDIRALKSVLYCYLGLALGDLLSGFLSQWIRSRTKTLYLFVSLTAAFTLVYVFSNNLSVSEFYWLCFGLGFAVGYWAVFVTVAAEQFGTNLRATVTTTVPNFVRGAVVPMTLGFQALHAHFDLHISALIVGAVVLTVSFLSVAYLKESFGKDLDFLEH